MPAEPPHRRLLSFVSRHPDGSAFGWLVSLTLSLFGGFLSPSTSRVLSLPGEDLEGQFLWWRQFGFGELAKGHLVLWNPHLFCGTPFFGGFQSALLYPPNWLFLFLPLPFAVNLNIALHIFLAGWFTFLWVRVRGSHPLSALLAACGFMLGASTILHIVPGHLPNLCAMPWIPLLFWAVDGYRRGREAKFLYGGTAALALQIFSGHVQYVYYTGLAIGLYTLWILPKTEKRISFLSGLAGMGLGAGLLSAVQLLTGLQASGESVRGQQMSVDFLNAANLNVERLWMLLLPGFFGGVGDYWGGGIYWEGPVFISVTGFVLALFALKNSDHPQKKVLGFLALFLVLLSLGKATPLFALFCKYFPMFDRFRGAGKLNAVITLFLVALAALGMDVVLKSPERLKGLGRGTAWGAGALAFFAFAFFLAPHVGGARLFKQFLPHAGAMAWSLFTGGLFLAGLSLLAYAGAKRPWVRWALVLVAVGELWIYAQSNLVSFDFKDAQQKIASLQSLYEREPGDYRVCVEKKDYTLGTTGADIWGEDPLIPMRYALFTSKVANRDLDYVVRPLSSQVAPPFGLLRLRYVLSQQGNAFIPHPTGYRETPRVFLAGEWEVLPWQGILDKITAPGFDPTREVLLESDPGLGPATGKVKGNISVKDLSTERIEVTADCPKPAVLVMTDNDSQGWKASALEGSDQKAFSILPAYGFFRAVPLQGGHHHFLMEYRPEAFVVGKWISIFSWAAFAILPLWRRKF